MSYKTKTRVEPRKSIRMTPNPAPCIPVDEDTTITWDGPAADETSYPSGTLHVRLRHVEESPVSVPPEE
jgi:hypothetical protein